MIKAKEISQVHSFTLPAYGSGKDTEDNAEISLRAFRGRSRARYFVSLLADYAEITL